MPFSKRGKVRQQEELLHGAWEWAAEAQKENAVTVTFCLAPTSREGVFKVICREHWVFEGRPLGLRRNAAEEWPSSSYGTLEGALLDAMMRMDASPVQNVLPWLLGPE